LVDQALKLGNFFEVLDLLVGNLLVKLVVAMVALSMAMDLNAF
jgi:hypothetical protein